MHSNFKPENKTVIQWCSQLTLFRAVKNKYHFSSSEYVNGEITTLVNAVGLFADIIRPPSPLAIFSRMFIFLWLKG